MRNNYIVITSITACTLLYIIEQGLAVNYAVKTLAKILLFIGVALYYQRFVAHSNKAKETHRNLQGKNNVLAGLLIGLAAFVIIIVTYYLTTGLVDYQGIVNELQDKSGITAINFIFVGLYITLGNSFLEEYFFRGFIFLNLYRQGRVNLAYAFSSLIFALYHMAIFRTWFTGGLMVLALVGLLGIAMILNWLTARSGSYFSAWVAHALADSAIILVGLRLFNVI